MAYSHVDFRVDRINYTIYLHKGIPRHSPQKQPFKPLNNGFSK